MHLVAAVHTYVRTDVRTHSTITTTVQLGRNGVTTVIISVFDARRNIQNSPISDGPKNNLFKKSVSCLDESKFTQHKKANDISPGARRQRRAVVEVSCP